MAAKNKGTLDSSPAYFHKTVGVTPKNTIEEQELAVAHLARNCSDTHDFLDLTDELGLTDVVQSLAQQRGVA